VSEQLSSAMRRDFAVIIPALDEAPVIPDLIRELRQLFERFELEGEVILVDDGSTDGTGDLALAEGAEWKPLRVLRHSGNRGKTEALLTAARATDRGHLVLFDADLQHAPIEIVRLLSTLEEGWDIVCGRKVGHYDKQGVSSVYNGISRRMFGVPVSDLNSIKAFRREVLEGLHLRHDWHRFFVVLAHARGHTVTEIDVELLPRRAGVSKYQGSGRVVVGVMDLLSVWFLLLFSRKPLLLFGTVGGLFILLGGAIGIMALYLRLAHDAGFRPLLDLVILLESVGFTLVGFGLLGEMIAQLREEIDTLRRSGSR